MKNTGEPHIENNKKRSTQCFLTLNSDEGRQRWKSQAMSIECDNSERLGVANATLLSPQLIHDQLEADLQEVRDQHLQRTMRQAAAPSQIPPSNAPTYNPGTMFHSAHSVPLDGPQSWGMTAESWMWDDEHLFLQPARAAGPSSNLSSERIHKPSGHLQQEPSLNCLVGQVAQARSHQNPPLFNGLSHMATKQPDDRSGIAMGIGPNQQHSSFSSQAQRPAYTGSHQQNVNGSHTNNQGPFFTRERSIARERQWQGTHQIQYQQAHSLNPSYSAGAQYGGTTQGNFGAPMNMQQPAPHVYQDTLQPIKWVPQERLTTQLEAARQSEDHVSYRKMPQSSYNQQHAQRLVNNRSSPKAFAPTVPGERLQDSERSRFVAIMSLPSDRQQLTVYQILLRESLEYFAASQHDVDSPVRGRKQKIRLGQIGVRCRYCSHMRLNYRGKGAVYYPKSLINVYQAAQNIAGAHFSAEKFCCPFVPFSVVEEIEIQKPRRDASKAGRAYWVEACQKLGIKEADDGLWHCPSQVNNVDQFS